MSTGQEAEGNHRSGDALAMHHRLCDIQTHAKQIQDGGGCENSPYLSSDLTNHQGIWRTVTRLILSTVVISKF